MKLGTGETIIVEVQIDSMLEQGWGRVNRVGMSWDDYKQMIKNFLLEKENEDERKHARENSYSE